MSATPQWPDDPVLAQMPRAVDADAMAAAFGELLQPHGTRVHACEVERIKYRPGRNCTLSYLLRLRRQGSGSVFEQRVSARLCSAGDSARRHASAAARPHQASPAGPSLAMLPSLDMLTWWWPNDARLSAPQVLADAPLLRTQVLPAVLTALGGSAARLIGHDIEIAQYVPEQRLTARVDLRWAAGAAEHTQRVYAKASREPDGAIAHRILRTLQQSPAWRTGRLCTPMALLWQAEAGLHWQTGVPGQALLDLPAEQAARLSATLGAQLAALHTTPVDVARTLDTPTLVARLDEVSTTLHAALPGARADLADAAAHLSRGLHWLSGAPLASLHGDLHPRNVLAEGERLSIIDLDGLRRGPALLELGGWVADGIYRAVLDGAEPLRDAPNWQALLAAYAAAGGNHPAPAALAWATAWMLLTQRAWRCVVNLKPGRFAIAPHLVTLAARLACAPRLDLT